MKSNGGRGVNWGAGPHTRPKEVAVTSFGGDRL